MASATGWNLYSRLANPDYRDILKWSKICLISKQKTFQRLEKSWWSGLWCFAFFFYHRILNNLKWPAGRIMTVALTRRAVIAGASLICFFQAALFFSSLSPCCSTHTFRVIWWWSWCFWDFAISWYFPLCYYSAGCSNCPHPSPKPSVLDGIGKLLEITHTSLFFSGGNATEMTSLNQTKNLLFIRIVN